MGPKLHWLLAMAGFFLFFQNCSETANFGKRVDSFEFLGERPLSEMGDSTNTGDPNADDGAPIGLEPMPNGESGLEVGAPATPAPGMPQVCNPLNPEMNCSPSIPNRGLAGNLFYLTRELHAPLFQDDLNRARLDDYRVFGVRVPVTILMTSLNVPPRSWELGFSLGEQGPVRKEDGTPLLEWFSLDLSGFIQLPAGTYQFATNSDDGVRVRVNREMVVEDDSVHAPRFVCSSVPVEFGENQRQPMQVQYFQGPRNQIALQVFVRPWSERNRPCTGDNLTLLPEEALSRQ